MYIYVYIYKYTHADSSSSARDTHSQTTSPDNAATHLSSTPSRYNMYHSYALTHICKQVLVYKVYTLIKEYTH